MSCAKPFLNNINPKNAVMQQLSGNGSLQNSHIEMNSGRQYNYPLSYGVTLPNLVCSNGSANADNACVCGGSLNTPPFNAYTPEFQSNYFTQLYGPEFPIPEPTDAVKQLVSQRKRLPANAYTSLEQ